jgi:hypothetical protein
MSITQRGARKKHVALASPDCLTPDVVPQNGSMAVEFRSKPAFGLLQQQVNDNRNASGAAQTRGVAEVREGELLGIAGHCL